MFSWCLQNILENILQSVFSLSVNIQYSWANHEGINFTPSKKFAQTHLQQCPAKTLVNLSNLQSLLKKNNNKKKTTKKQDNRQIKSMQHDSCHETSHSRHSTLCSPLQIFTTPTHVNCQNLQVTSTIRAVAWQHSLPVCALSTYVFTLTCVFSIFIWFYSKYNKFCESENKSHIPL